MAKDSLAEYARGFDTAAADFDALGVHVWGPIGRALVAATGPASGDRLLDACCGTGASAIPAAHAVGPDGVVDAVDTSAPMIGVLNRTAAVLPQLRGHTSDVLTWKHDGYEIVQAALGIFFFPDITAGTDHLVELARPGGRVGFTIWRSGAMEVPGRHLGQAVTAVTRTDPPERKPHLINQINNPDGYQDWLIARGLNDVRVIVDERRLRLTDELAWLIVTGSGFRAALTDLEPARVEDIRQRYLGSLADEGVTEVDASTLIGIGTRPSRM